MDPAQLIVGWMRQVDRKGMGVRRWFRFGFSNDRKNCGEYHIDDDIDVDLNLRHKKQKLQLTQSPPPLFQTQT